jgi:uncharacterized protein with PhoU and TrkA domain
MISSQSKACNQKIGDLWVESETGMRIIAIRRDKCWIYNPGPETELKSDDWLITRGTDEGFNELNNFLKGKSKELE